MLTKPSKKVQASVDYTAESIQVYADAGVWAGGPDKEITGSFLDVIPDCLEGKTVVDLGCGGGELINKVLSQRGKAKQVIGFDISPEFLNAARKNIPAGQEDVISFVAADMDAGIPLSSGAVDLVVSRFALHYSQDIEALFDAVRSVLRPGGLFVFLTNSFSGSEVLGKWIPIRLSPKLVVHNFARSEQEYRDALQGGFRLVQCQASDATSKIDPAFVHPSLATVRAFANLFVAIRV